jgi:hypothetical protein
MSISADFKVMNDNWDDVILEQIPLVEEKIEERKIFFILIGFIKRD